MLGRWHGLPSMFSSITCGHQAPLLISEQGELIELEGVCGAIADAVDATAASTVRALEDAITAASADALQDDATIVVFAPTSP